MDFTNSSTEISRRNFLKATSSFAFILSLDPLTNLIQKATADEIKTFSPNVYLSIRSDNVVQMICHRAEMGQGARTSMPMLLAEELEMDVSQLEVVQALGHPKYGDQNTDGSTSVRVNWEPLRQAGATAREMLLEAAAQTWNVPKSECLAQKGKILHTKSKKSLTYGQLAEKAASLPLPKEVKLKAPKNFKVIGKPVKFVDLDAITTGKAKFGIDSEIPGMVHAVLVRCPRLAGKVKSYDAKPALAVSGVKKVFKIPALPQDVNSYESLVVIADHTYAAIKGAKELKVEWDLGPGPLESSESKRKEMEAALKTPGKVVRAEGDFEKAFKECKKKLSSRFYVPYLVHAQMEPPNAVAQVKDGVCEIWAPTQQPQRARSSVARTLKLPEDKVLIHQTLLGGGFGRKSQPDFCVEAAVVAKEVGKPVKITWTRENDIQNGFYHAISLQEMNAGLDEKNQVVAWEHKSSFPTILKVFDPAAMNPAEFEVGQGQINMPYRVPHIRCTANPVTSDLRVGWLRSVCNIFHGFAVNSFIDEIAEETKQDPVDLRLKLIGAKRVLVFEERDKNTPFQQDTDRLVNVIKRTAKLANWKKRKLPKGHGIGFASHYSFYTHVAMAIEVAVKDFELTIVRVDCVADCGTVVNPDTVKAQLEGGIIYGLSLATIGEISLDKGTVIQSNFHDYPILRLNQIPKINIELVQSQEIPTGIGEPGTPPVAPALASAIFSATKKRVRELPLSKLGYEIV